MPVEDTEPLNSTSLNTTDVAVWGSQSVLTLLILYGFVFPIGFISNVLVIFGIAFQSSRIRNVVMLSLCIADLLVCCVSMPISVMVVALKRWTLGPIACKVAFYLQSLPVAASTISMMMLAVDRYAAIKHPRFLRPQSSVTLCMIVTVWSSASLISLPIFYIRQVVDWHECYEVWPTAQWKTAFTFTHLVVVYFIPCITVASCHFSVGHQLCTSSLATAAAQGKLPLPMPLIRKPKHVIIVTSVLHDGPSKIIPYGGEHDSSSDEDRIRTDIARRSNLLTVGPNKSFSRSNKNIIQDNRRHSGQGSMRPPLMRQVSRQSLNSRRRLANMLVAMVIVFTICWAPYVVFTISSEFRAVPQEWLPYFLLLGHLHSTINPLVNWLSNRQSLHLPTCGWQPSKILTKHFRRNQQRPPPSSTNEGALGVFHPCYTTKRFQPRRHCTNDFL